MSKYIHRNAIPAITQFLASVAVLDMPLSDEALIASSPDKSKSYNAMTFTRDELGWYHVGVMNINPLIATPKGYEELDVFQLLMITVEYLLKLTKEQIDDLYTLPDNKKEELHHYHNIKLEVNPDGQMGVVFLPDGTSQEDLDEVAEMVEVSKAEAAYIQDVIDTTETKKSRLN